MKVTVHILNCDIIFSQTWMTGVKHVMKGSQPFLICDRIPENLTGKVASGAGITQKSVPCAKMLARRAALR